MIQSAVSFALPRVHLHVLSSYPVRTPLFPYELSLPLLLSAW